MDASGYELGRRLFAADLFHVGRAGFGVSILWFVVMAVVGAWGAQPDQGGQLDFAVGGNHDAARMVGVPAAATKVGLFMVVGLCGWIHGMVVLFRPTVPT